MMFLFCVARAFSKNNHIPVPAQNWITDKLHEW